MPPIPVTDQHINAAATLIAYEVPTDLIRESLLARGLSDYSAYLAYQAAKQLLKAGVYDRR